MNTTVTPETKLADLDPVIREAYDEFVKENASDLLLLKLIALLEIIGKLVRDHGARIRKLEGREASHD